MISKKLSYLGCWLVILWQGGWPTMAQAQVIINEVYPNPNTGENEWVELLNRGEEAVDLQGWQLWDQQSSVSLAHSFDQPINLPVNQFLIIYLSNVLNNAGDGLILKNQLGESVDTFAYSSSTKGQSWFRDPLQIENILAGEPTLSAPNPIPTPTPTPSPTPATNPLTPRLSEVMACPEDTSEWVELYNPHPVKLALVGYSLRDDKNKIFGFTDEQLEPTTYLSFELRNVLNNSGDSVTLVSPTNQVIDSFSYQQCLTGTSFAKNDQQQWQSTQLITQNSANLFSVTSQTQAATTSQNTLRPANRPEPAQASTTTNQFLYPLSVLNPKLDHEKMPLPDEEHLVFSPPPRLERGVWSVIMGSLLLLIPGFIYVKNRQQFF